MEYVRPFNPDLLAPAMRRHGSDREGEVTTQAQAQAAAQA